MAKEKHEKVTWDKMYKTFREKHPSLAKKCARFRPYNYGQILVYGQKSENYVYDYDTDEVTIVKFV